MIKELDLKRFYFELNDENPIQVILNHHNNNEEEWFDMHYELELGIVIKGRMKREYFGHEMDIGPGEIWLCNMWEPHGFELLETPCEVVVFVIDPKYLINNHFLNRDVLSAFMAPPNERPKATEKNITNIIDLAIKVQNYFKKNIDADWAKVYLYQLLLLLVDKWEAPKDKSTYMLRESIHEALRLIFEERRLITTKEAAKVCRMSVTKFTYHFKSLMGSSFSEFALQYRIKGASAQLKTSDLTQEAIALNWGFTDASHLHKYL